MVYKQCIECCKQFGLVRKLKVRLDFSYILIGYMFLSSKRDSVLETKRRSFMFFCCCGIVTVTLTKAVPVFAEMQVHLLPQGDLLIIMKDLYTCYCICAIEPLFVLCA